MPPAKTARDDNRPIPAAAAAVKATADKARQMLEDLEAGWLWKLLTIRPKPPQS